MFEVIGMETGLLTKEVFNIVVGYVTRFKDDIKYYAKWKVESIEPKDQVFVTLVKVKQNYASGKFVFVQCGNNFKHCAYFY